jgi:hypothetical protein
VESRFGVNAREHLNGGTWIKQLPPQITHTHLKKRDREW